MQNRFENIKQKGFPYIVLVDRSGGGTTTDEDGRSCVDLIVGYAYATTFRGREGFNNTAEISIYLKPGTEGRRLGSKLMDRLIELCVRVGLRQLVSVIGGSDHTSITYMGHTIKL